MPDRDVQADWAEIPEELRARDQWVVWVLEERDGKPTKRPLASTTDPHSGENRLKPITATNNDLKNLQNDMRRSVRKHSKKLALYLTAL